MKLTITKTESGYVINTDGTTFSCTNFLELVQYLESFFHDHLPNIEIDWLAPLDIPNDPFPIKPIPSPTSVPERIIGKCSKCGLELCEFMGYYCNNFPCPAGLGGSMSY